MRAAAAQPRRLGTRTLQPAALRERTEPRKPPEETARRKKYGPQPVRTEARESGSGCAMERAVREGDTGLHHTAKDPSVSAGSEPANRFRLARWSVRSAVFYRTIIERFAASDGRGHHRRLVPSPSQASWGANRDAGTDHADRFPDFNTRSTRNSTLPPHDRRIARQRSSMECEKVAATPLIEEVCVASRRCNRLSTLRRKTVERLRPQFSRRRSGGTNRPLRRAIPRRRRCRRRATCTSRQRAR